MRYGSVCSGIEAATQAWRGLGWEPQWFSEIEKFPSAVLRHHYPNVPNLGDMTTIRENKTHGKENTIDLLVGGTPCQSFSVAGLRGGLEDERGNLCLEFVRLAECLQPRWLVWENVPGVLSSNQGKDFGTLLGALGEIGYGFAYRVLDAQFFRVPQRRRRLFLVGCLRDWRSAAAVLLEPKSLFGNTPSSRSKGEEVAADTRGGIEREGEVLSFRGTGFGQYIEGVPGTLKASGGDIGGGSETFAVHKNTPITVRRLTPTECERLQGFPDGYTKISWRKKAAENCPDGLRYKALGNSMAVPVMRWIGKRIQSVDRLTG